MVAALLIYSAFHSCWIGFYPHRLQQACGSVEVPSYLQKTGRRPEVRVVLHWLSTDWLAPQLAWIRVHEYSTIRPALWTLTLQCLEHYNITHYNPHHSQVWNSSRSTRWLAFVFFVLLQAKTVVHKTPSRRHNDGATCIKQGRKENNNNKKKSLQ